MAFFSRNGEQREKCGELKADYFRLLEIKTFLDRELPLVKDSPSLWKAKSIAETIEERIQKLIEKSNPLEKILHIKEQYEEQVSILKEADLIEKLSDESVGFVREGLEYPMPGLAEVRKKIRKNHKVIAEKLKDGFEHLKLVPFGIGLGDFLHEFLEAIRKMAKEGSLAYLKDNKRMLHSIDLNKFEISDEFQRMGKRCRYDFKSFKPSSGGKTKEEILAEYPERAWEMTLMRSGLEVSPTLEREVRLRGSRIFSGRGADQAWTLIKKIANKNNEQFINTEEWFVWAVGNILNNNPISPDSYHLGAIDSFGPKNIRVLGGYKPIIK